MDAMKSFGRLLGKMRGPLSLRELGRRTGFTPEYLSGVESGRKIPDEQRARRILHRGFALDERDTGHVLLGVQLYDLGLRDAELRLLVIGLVQNTVPDPLRQELRRLYRRYASGTADDPSASR